MTAHSRFQIFRHRRCSRTIVGLPAVLRPAGWSGRRPNLQKLLHSLTSSLSQQILANSLPTLLRENTGKTKESARDVWNFWRELTKKLSLPLAVGRVT